MGEGKRFQEMPYIVYIIRTNMHKFFSIGKPLLLIFLLVITFASCVVIPTYLGKSSINETDSKKSEVKVTNVLIAGAGSTASRLFLENLSIELAKNLSENQIASDFKYVGKIPRGSSLDLKQILTPKYDGYLVLNPTDTSYAETNASVGIVATAVSTGSVIGNRYNEAFNLEFYTNQDSLSKIWQGNIKVDFDFATPNRYKTIAKTIINKFIEKGIISKIR